MDNASDREDFNDDFALRCVWDGEAIRPRGDSLRVANKMWGAGEIITVFGAMERGAKSHRHYFAELKDLFDNIPDRLQNMPFAVNPEAFRKHALIETGNCDVQTAVAGSAAAAERMAALIRAIPGVYRIVSCQGSSVKVFTPVSQSYRSMSKADFERTKSAVLNWCEGVVKGQIYGNQ